MTESQRTYDALLDRFVTWASARRDIRAAAIIGSRARADHPADEWSDIDIVLVATHPDRYLQDANWLKHIGNPWLTCAARVEGQTFRAAWFESEAKLDFIIVSSRSMRVAAAVLRLVTRFPGLKRFLPKTLSYQLATFSETISRGMRVLIDKESVGISIGGRLRAATVDSPAGRGRVCEYGQHVLVVVALDDEDPPARRAVARQTCVRP